MSELLAEINHQLSHYLPQSAISAFAAIGLLYAAKKSIGAVSNTVSTLHNMTPAKSKDLAERYGQGSWVLITGATSGIGKEYVYSMARRGFNIILIGKNPIKVVSFSEELKNNFKIDVRPVIANFRNAEEPEFFEKIYKQIEGLDISVIINNVGISVMDMFQRIDKEKMIESDMVNLLPMVMITRHYINHMLGRSKRSAIINLSSVAAKSTSAKHGIYSPSKAFADCFSENMFEEYKHKIDVLSVRPQFVWTKMFKTIGGTKNWCTVTPDQTAEESLGWLGKGRYFTYGARWHELVGHLHENSTLFHYYTTILNSKK